MDVRPVQPYKKFSGSTRTLLNPVKLMVVRPVNLLPNHSGNSVMGDDENGEKSMANSPEHPARKPVSYTHLRAHETVLDLVCRLLLEKKNKQLQTKKYDM
eukprot:TRINITY_DN13686_c0_g1_i1.p1 TRINITY_DN13686_c0_g1~~TRINITY_DN13686_c0_g1_i1.p1  ORF type:complete len:100 (-),score=19.47 TRINITY_DN13686_c0_g1_i1:6-305(-)